MRIKLPIHNLTITRLYTHITLNETHTHTHTVSARTKSKLFITQNSNKLRIICSIAPNRVRRKIVMTVIMQTAKRFSFELHFTEIKPNFMRNKLRSLLPLLVLIVKHFP